MQALNAELVELIGATVARAVTALYGACNAIGGGGCPIGSIAIGGCPMPWTIGGELSEVVQLCPGCAMAWTVARIMAGLDIWQGVARGGYGYG